MAEPSLHHLLASVTVSGKKEARRDDITDQDLSDRMIMSLVFDVTQLADDIEQVKVNLYGLARQRGMVKEDTEAP